MQLKTQGKDTSEGNDHAYKILEMQSVRELRLRIRFVFQKGNDSKHTAKATHI